MGHWIQSGAGQEEPVGRSFQQMSWHVWRKTPTEHKVQICASGRLMQAMLLQEQALHVNFEFVPYFNSIPAAYWGMGPLPVLLAWICTVQLHLHIHVHTQCINLR